LPHVGKFEGVISKFWYIGGYIARPWINHEGKVSFFHNKTITRNSTNPCRIGLY
jgi:hypothetical protein